MPRSFLLPRFHDSDAVVRWALALATWPAAEIGPSAGWAWQGFPYKRLAAGIGSDKEFQRHSAGDYPSAGSSSTNAIRRSIHNRRGDHTVPVPLAWEVG